MADASDDRWRDSLLEMPPQTIAAPGEGEDGQHEHKRARMDPVDAVRVLKGLRFARFLKNKKEFSAAMGAAVDFERDDDEFHPRDSSKDPSRRTFQRGATKVDICGMLLQRREFKADRLEDRIAAIQLFTDSSPTAGVELQGMVMEVVQRSLHVRRTILPGSTLAYGQFDAVSKGVVLLYALWLVSGPFFCDLNYTLGKVVCITTDFGLEVRTLELPDILRAFVRWLDGTLLIDCAPDVKHDKRLFRRAFRISGWSHMYGNLMHMLATKTCKDWDQIVASLRIMCQCLRQGTWRQNIQRCLRLKGLPADELDSFTATLVHKRYETVADVTGQLANIRDICENHVKYEMFANPQDRVLITSMVEACRNKHLWRWITCSSREIWGPSEGSGVGG